MTHCRRRSVWGLRQIVSAFRVGVFVLASTQLSLAGGSDPGDMPPAPQEPVTVTNPTTGQPITLTPEIPQYGNSGNGTPGNPLTGGLVSSPPITVNPPPPADPAPQPPATSAPPAQPTDPGGAGLQPPEQPITDPGAPPLRGGVSINVPGTGSPSVPGTGNPPLKGGVTYTEPLIPGHGTPGAAPELQFWEGVTAGARDVYTNEWANLPVTAIQKLFQKFGPAWLRFLIADNEIAAKVKEVMEMIEKSGEPVGGSTYETGYRLGQQIAKIVVMTDVAELGGEEQPVSIHAQ